MRRGRDVRPSRAVAPVLLAAAAAALGPSPAEAQTTDSGQLALPEILVTAQRRSEPLQRVPVSVVALSAKDLESRSVTNTRTLQDFVPNLTFAPSQNVGEAAGNIFIRGIGQEDFGVGAEAGVGFYVDGVYYARPLGTIMNLIDVARIEVLRGPQGTLFGKNTIGGAINIVSNPPRPDRERRVKLILGNFDRMELRGIANEPLSERLLMRLAIGTTRRDGYVRRLLPPASLALIEQANASVADLRPEGSDNSQAARLQLRWLVTDTLTADLSMDTTRKRSTQGATHIDVIDSRFGGFPDLNQLILAGRLPGPLLTNDLIRRNLLENYSTGANFINQNFWGGSVVVTKALGPNSLKFIGAYRGLRSRLGTDNDGLYFNSNQGDLRVDHHQFSGELQFSGKAGPLVYTSGLFAIRESGKLHPTNSIGDAILFTCGCFYGPGDTPEFTTSTRRVRSDSYAAFAQGTYAITNKLSATLGGRFSNERKSLDGKTLLQDPAANFAPTDIVLETGHNRDSWSSFTYRAGVEYQAQRDLMVYASVATGFKSGGFNVRGDANLPNMGFYAFRPESARTFEIGLHSEWLHRRLRFNAALFHTDYRDIQLRQQTIVDGEFTTLIENAAKARIRGAEVELTAAPVKGLTLSAAYGHLDPRYLDVGEVLGLTLKSRFQRTRRHSFSGSVNYEAPLGPGTIELHGDVSYRSREQFQILPAVNDQKGYWLAGARITFRAPDERWSIAVFAVNLTDQRYRSAGRGTLLRQVGFAYSSVGMPRQIGVELTAGF